MIVRFILVALSTVFVFLGTMPTYANGLKIQEVKSASGISAWLVEDKTIPILSLRFQFIGAGSVNDTLDKQGVSQLLSTMMDEGAGDLDSKAFQETLTNNSISLSFSSGRDDFGGELKTLSKYRDTAFSMLSLALTKPRFDAEPLARMKEANLVRIRSNMTDPEWMNARLVNHVIYGTHPYAMNSGGTLSSLPRITRDDLVKKHQEQLALDNLIVTVAGDISADELRLALDKIFGGLPKTSTVKKVDPVTLSSSSSLTLYQQDIPQTIVALVLPGIKHEEADYPAAEIMDFVLGSSGFGSRLTDEVREKRGLTYGIYSGFTELEQVALLSIGSSTRNENTQDLIAVTKSVLGKMNSDPITEEELRDAKTYLIGSVPLQLTSTDRITRFMMALRRDNLPKNYLELREQRLREVTQEDVLRVSQRLLQPDLLQIILVGNPKITESPTIVSTLPHVE
jgi:zinc protease